MRIYFFTLTHTLRGIVHCTKYLLNTSKLSFALLGKLNNNPIKMYFYKLRTFVGYLSALDMSTLQNYKRILLHNQINHSYYNNNKILSRKLIALLFEGIGVKKKIN